MIVGSLFVFCSCNPIAHAQTAPAARSAPPANAAVGGGIDYRAKNQDPRARALLDETKAKLQRVNSLVVDFEIGEAPRPLPTAHFDRQGEMTLERPNRFKVEGISGLLAESRAVWQISDGLTVTDLTQARANGASIVLAKPVRAENFFLGVNSLVQFFFDPRGIAFDPTGALWDRPISEFDTNLSAYDRDTKLTYLGTRTLEGTKYQVVEIKYNTTRTDIRQQIYVGPNKLIYQVDTSLQTIGPTRIFTEKFRNFRLNPRLPAATWQKEIPPKVPTIATDPVRMGAQAPDFVLPGYNGGELTLKDLLKNKKGLFVCVLDGAMGKSNPPGPDGNLAQMRLLQEMKDKFEKQGLGVVSIVGGDRITPDVTDEMKLNWMPDVSRFNYPIAIDVDLERGLQGSAYHNFQLNGRNSVLLDGKGRVVFASQSFTDAVNNLAFYQALAQLGFHVSPADLENAAK